MDQGPNFVDFSDNIFKDYLTKKNREFSIPPDQNSWILKKYFQDHLEQKSEISLRKQFKGYFEKIF